MTEADNSKFSKELDLLRIVHQIIHEWKLGLWFVGVAGVLGVIVALFRPKYFTSTVILAPELSSKSDLPSSLTSLSSMMGLDFGSLGRKNPDAIYPEIYPEVLRSPDFLIELFDAPVTLDDGTATTYSQHLAENYKDEDRAELIRSAIDLHHLTKAQDRMCNTMSRNILASLERDNSLITITVTDEDPQVAYAIADTVQSKLQEYISAYRTKKARIDYDYTKVLVDKARQEYLDAQRAAATYADANISVFKQKVIIQSEILQNEFQIKYQQYNALAQQLQAAEAQIQESTPVYTIIRSASAPNRSSSTPRSVIVLLWLMVGFACYVVWVGFGRDFWHHINTQYATLNSTTDSKLYN